MDLNVSYAIIHIFITAFKYEHDVFSEGSGSLVRPPCISQGCRDLKRLQNFIHYSKKYSQLHFAKSFQSKRPCLSLITLHFFIYRAPTVCRTLPHTRVFVYMNYSRQQFSDCGYSTVVLLLKKNSNSDDEQLYYIGEKNGVGFILKQLSLRNC